MDKKFDTYWLKIKKFFRYIISSEKIVKLSKIKITKVKIKSFIIAVIGFILSPLSWWNDLFVNIPLAYLFAIPFGYISNDYFLPAMVAGYWITNIIGFIMLHIGLFGMFKKEKKEIFKKTINSGYSNFNSLYSCSSIISTN